MARKYSRWREAVNRRHFLAAITTTTASASISAAPMAAASEVVRIEPRKRLESDIEAWNIGLITAHRGELSLHENSLRNVALCREIHNSGFGLLHVRGQYIPSAGVEPIEQHAFLLVGSADDSGNLKGFLRKAGRRFEQDAVIWKGYYRDVLLFALKDLPAAGMANGDTKTLGWFHPNHIARYHALMTRWSNLPHPLSESTEYIDSADEHWKDYGIWTQPTFLNRQSRRVEFDETGKRSN